MPWSQQSERESHNTDSKRPESIWLELSGRDREIQVLTDVLENTSNGAGRLVIVGGEGGIGKTILVDAAAQVASAGGFTVLTGNCYDIDNRPIYGPWRNLLERLDRRGDDDAGMLLASFQNDSGGVRDLSDLYLRVEQFIQSKMSAAPVLVVIEDVQWADRASLDLLRFLARRLTDLPVSIVLTCQDTGLSADLPFYHVHPLLIREASPVRIHLRPLANDAVVQIMERRYRLERGEAQRLATYIQRYAEGNPFYVGELANHLENEGTLEQRDGQWTFGDVPEFRVPPLIQQMISSRIGRISDSSIDLLRTAAVLGTEAQIDLWQQVSGATTEELAACIDEALQFQIITEVPERDSIRFRHALVRQVFYDELQMLLRRTRHRDAAESMIRGTRVDPSLVAHHFRQAQDPRAIEWLLRGGRAAIRAFAFSTAVNHFEQAMALLERHPHDENAKAWGACELAAAHRFTDPESGLVWINRAAEFAVQSEDAVLAVAIPWVRSLLRGFLDENGLPEFYDAVAAFDTLKPDDEERIEQTSLAYIIDRAHINQRIAFYGRYSDAADYGRRFLDESSLPVTASDRNAHGIAQLGLGIALANLGFPEEARSSFSAARDHFNAIGNDLMLGTNDNYEYRMVIEPYFPERVDLRRRLIDRSDQHYKQSVIALVSTSDHHERIFEGLVLDGRWDEARAAATGLVSNRYLRVACASTLAHLDRLQGFPDQAWQRIDTGLPDGASVEPTRIHYHEVLSLQFTAAMLAIEAGQLDPGRMWIKALQTWLNWSDTVLGQFRADLLLASFCQASGELDTALSHARRASRLAQSPRQPLGLLQAERMTGTLLQATGDTQQSARHLSIAVDLARTIQAPFEIALSEAAYASHLVQLGDASGAADLLRSARAILTRLQAAPALEELSEIEARADATVQKPRETHGLSPRELEVLRLVATGLTDAEIGDRLFISRRTVSAHLQSIFNKCGVASRAAATAYAYEHQIIAAGE